MRSTAVLQSQLWLGYFSSNVIYCNKQNSEYIAQAQKCPLPDWKSPAGLNLPKLLSGGRSRVVVEAGDWLHLMRGNDLGIKMEAHTKGLRYFLQYKLATG